jgi:hypothetical protein
MSVKISAAVGAALLATSALAAHPARADAQERSKVPHQHVLAAFSTRRLMILPTHYLRMGDSLGWAGQITDQTAYLSSLDDEVAFAFSDRGVKKMWVFPAAIDAIAKRNEAYAPDPHAMAAQWLRFPGPKRLPTQLPDPLASQLRTLVAMQEGGQLVLLPSSFASSPCPAGCSAPCFDSRFSTPFAPRSSTWRMSRAIRKPLSGRRSPRPSPIILQTYLDPRINE